MEFLHPKVHRDFLPYDHHLHWPHLDLEHIPYPVLDLEPTLDYDPILEHHPYLHHPFSNDTSDTDTDITMVDSPPRTPSPTSELDELPVTPPPKNAAAQRAAREKIPATWFSIPEVPFVPEEPTLLPFSTPIGESRMSVAKVPLTLTDLFQSHRYHSYQVIYAQLYRYEG